MNFLIDTHIFIWLLFDLDKLSSKQLAILQNPDNNIFVSNIAFWEIALKYAKNKLDLFGLMPEELPQAAINLNLKIIDIDAKTMANSYQLLPVKKHKDPFDRMIIWFCIENNYTLVSNDNRLYEYQQQGLKSL